MDLFHSYSLLVTLSFLLLSVLVKRACSPKSSSLNLPPGPWKLPVIGSIHHMFTSLPHHAFRRLAKRHGPIMLVTLGQLELVVVSSRETASVIMKSEDLNFCSRPDLSIARVLSYGATDIVCSPYGEYWRQLKKICVIELLSAKRVRSFHSLFQEELTVFISGIYCSKDRNIVNLSDMLRSLMNNIISRCAFGSKSHDQQKFLSVVKEAKKLASGLGAADLFPRFKYIDVLSGTRSKVGRIHRLLDDIFSGIVQEHQAKRTVQGVNQVEDLVDILLRIRDQDELQIPLTVDNIKAVILDMFVGGTDTASSVVSWAMAELMKNPKVMNKAKCEVQQVMRGRIVIEESDLAELHYLKLVIKETLRLHPPLPLLIPRQCMSECQVGKYTISAGTRVIVNVWAIGRDQQYWGEDSENFNPERFNGSEVGYKGTNYEFLPFGAGRRVCPGILFGEASMGYTLAYLLLHFNWELPLGMRPEELDMTESFEVTTDRKTDLCLLATPYRPTAV